MARLRNTASCIVEGCCKKRKGRGLCAGHYHRLMRHGHPLGGGTPSGDPLDWIRKNASFDGEDCLIWPFSVGRFGPSTVRFNGRMRRASRVMCMIAHGEPPEESHHAAHSCGKGHLGCMNPRHLRWATTSENQMDRVEHGTSNRGERNGQAILTEEQVRAIKSSLARGEQGKVLAAQYSVSPMTISWIKRGERWAWVAP